MQNLQSAAPRKRDSSLNSRETYLVYVGCLSSSTTEQSIRLHLDEIGVRNNSVSDVIKLNCRKDSETSFCISLNDKSSKDIVYDSKSWPCGTRVRPFTQKARKPKHQNKYHGSRKMYEVPPRMRTNIGSHRHRHSCSYQCPSYESLTNHFKSYRNNSNWDTHKNWQNTEYPADNQFYEGDEWPPLTCRGTYNRHGRTDYYHYKGAGGHMAEHDYGNDCGYN